MIVCSNLGPTIACSLGLWLLLQIPVLFGACMVLIFSASSTVSTSGESCEPIGLVGVAFVADTFCVVAGVFGSFAGG